MTDSRNKAKRATIKIAGIEVEVFQLPDGEYVMSQTQIAEAVGSSEFQVRYFLRSEQVKALLGKDFKNVKISIENSRDGRGGRGHIVSIPTKLVSAFWIHQLSKRNIKAQALVYACVEEALERRCDAAFQQVKTEEEYEDIAIDNRRSWQESRQFLLDAHSSFTNSCGYWGFDAAKAHDEITLAVCGKTARELRELDVIEGNPKIGLNHIADKETLVKVAKVKLEFSRYRTGTAKQRVKRALESINN